MSYSNCKSVTAMSGACKRGSKTKMCQKQNVKGFAKEIWMYSDGWKGNLREPQPSGFYIKFSKSGWSRLFGTKGKTSKGKLVKKWKGKGRIIGITYDTSGQSDFLQFHMAYNASFFKPAFNPYAKCNGRDSGCKNIREGDGDCDYNRDCRKGLKCGIDNCGRWRRITRGGTNKMGWNKSDDCCYRPKRVVRRTGCNGRDSGCKNIKAGDGDCDRNSDCQKGLRCGKNNCSRYRSNKGWRSGNKNGWDRNDDCCYRPKRVVKPRPAPRRRAPRGCNQNNIVKGAVKWAGDMLGMKCRDARSGATTLTASLAAIGALAALF